MLIVIVLLLLTSKISLTSLISLISLISKISNSGWWLVVEIKTQIIGLIKLCGRLKNKHLWTKILFLFLPPTINQCLHLTFLTSNLVKTSTTGTIITMCFTLHYKEQINLLLQ